MSSGPYPRGKDIRIMNADGSNIIDLTNTPGIDMTICPSGRLDNGRKI